jgi:hypothetical protein
MSLCYRDETVRVEHVEHVGQYLETKIVGVSHWRRTSCLASRRRLSYITQACVLAVGFLTDFGSVQ